MARIKYYYNPETCRYEKIRISPWNIVRRFSGYIGISITFGICFTIFYHNYFDSPKEAALRSDNDLLRKNYKILEGELKKGKEQLTLLQERDNNLYRSLLDVDPIPATIQKAGSGGIDHKKSWPKDKLITGLGEKIEKLSRRLEMQNKSYDELSRLVKNKEDILASLPAIQPIANRHLKRLSAGFGMRKHPIFKIHKMHEGLDYVAPQGTPIYATGKGVIKYTNKSNVGYGNQVVIDHGYGLMTRYAHLKLIKVKTSETVERGQCIGYLGNTGCSSGPHVHYEVIKNGKKVNPIHYMLSGLNAREYDALVSLASRPTKSLD
jgi:murein DD-endopeptidase MepM/ murein hydrolase activator NlpD